MASEVEKLVLDTANEAHRLVLSFVAQDGSRVQCQVWQGPFRDPTETYEEIEERALRQANTLGGTHVFWVEALGIGDRAIASEVFRVTAEILPSGVNASSEPANEGGHYAQMMRHNEGYFRNSIASQREVTQGFKMLQTQTLQVLSTLTNRLNSVETRYGEQMMQVSQVIAGEREAEREALAETNRQAFRADMAKRATALLPEAIAAITGKRPEGAAAAAALSVKGLFATLTEKQVGTILAVLQPEQQAALLGLLKRLAAEDEAREAATPTPSTH